MGGDFGPRLSVPASLDFLQKYPDSRITLVGDSALIYAELNGHSCTRLHVQHAPDVVEAGDKPSSALRQKRESSLWQSLELVARDEADACVSAGNTGALMAMSKHLLGTFPGVSRPAICKPIPAKTGSSFLLDLGANLDCTAEHLVQFALMGSALARACGIERPRVALLNVGAEDAKGSPEIRQAAERLRALDSQNFVGFVEGDALFSQVADVIVCDGFAGNVALKVSEGVARLLFGSLERRLKASWRGRAARWLGVAGLKAWQSQFSPAKYNGAAFLGLRKPVIKSHGAADANGFIEALATAREHVKASLTSRLEQELAAASVALNPSA
jgi:glycerol-3-phosphate acyltransferase PlsX